MFGTGGNTGGSLMDTAMSVGAMTGVGPKGTQAVSRRALRDVQNEYAQIQNYIDSLKFSGLQQGGNQAFTQLQMMPRSSDLPWTGQTPQVNIPNAPGLDLGLQNVPWETLFNQTAKTPQQQLSQYNTVTPSQVSGSFIAGNEFNDFAPTGRNPYYDPSIGEPAY